MLKHLHEAFNPRTDVALYQFVLLRNNKIQFQNIFRFKSNCTIHITRTQIMYMIHNLLAERIIK